VPNAVTKIVVLPNRPVDHGSYDSRARDCRSRCRPRRACAVARCRV